MPDETENRPAQASDGGGRCSGGGGEPAPLQGRADFLQNWSWASVAEINGRLCARGGAQRGFNSETHQAVEEEWERVRSSELTLLDTLRFLKSCHRRAPFLFFNGNTFAEIGRALFTALFSDSPLSRKKEVASCAAHYITGVLDEDLMVLAINDLSRSAEWSPGDRVKTLRGSLRGVVVRLLEDGRVAWRPDGSSTDLIALPENLVAEKSPP